MWTIIAEKELKEHLQSARFIVTAGISMLLLIASMALGIQHYKGRVAQHDQAIQMMLETAAQQTNWNMVPAAAYRKPDVMEVFVNGVNSDIGRFSEITLMRNVRLVRSEFSDDPMLAVFQFLDPTFVVLIVLSLLAILFTYNAVNGEKESGTLKLVFANGISRAEFILGKLAGGWVALLVPVVLAFLIGGLMLILMGVEMDAAQWGKFGFFVLASVLYFTCFMLIGVLVSAFTGRSSVSFLVLLVLWISAVLIIPKASTMLAGQAMPVATTDEVESRLASFATQARTEFFGGMQQRWRERFRPTEGMKPEEATQYQAENRPAWEKEDQDARQEMEKKIADHTARSYEEYYNQKNRQEQLAFSLAKMSPASMFQLAAMKLAGTDTGLKRRYEDAMKNYRDQYTKFVQQKGGGFGGMRITVGRGSGGSVSMGGSQEGTKIDVGEMPRFQSPQYTLGEALTASLFDLGLLTIFNILAFVGAFIAFLRFDMR
ncbi:MAG: ABC transporter permease subunit [Ignavibacteriales bacterium]|nr:ABC transporter permease subunit [Ignavibacteriales bacterium]